MTDAAKQQAQPGTQDPHADSTKCAPAKQPAPPNPNGCVAPPTPGGAAADQTAQPQGCQPIDPSYPPAPKEPAPPECKRECTCPSAPTAPTDCFDDLIAAQEKEIAEAADAQAFKDELTDLQKKIIAAKLDYTQAKYDALLKEWKKQDGQIVELIRKLTCALPCWRCMVECSVCELIYAIRDNERALNGGGVPFTPTGNPCYSAADSLYDLQYWFGRKAAAMQATVDRIKAVLAAWEKPAQRIEETLANDAQIITDAQNVLAPDAAKLIYDVFFVLVPRHLAIAPPPNAQVADTQTAIQAQYADLLCPCDDRPTPENCCGPNTAALSLRDRLVGPLPYLVQPALYGTLVCCLVECRYLPARNALATAKGEQAAADAAVKKAQDFITDKRASLEIDAKTNLIAYQCPPPGNGSNGSDGDKNSSGGGTTTPAAPTGSAVTSPTRTAPATTAHS